MKPFYTLPLGFKLVSCLPTWVALQPYIPEKGSKNALKGLFVDFTSDDLLLHHKK
jgi:hypothetical protein